MMKKLVAFIVGLIIFGMSAVTVSAAENYEVKKGDTLWDIAMENNMTVEQLMEINKLTSSLIYPKQELIIDADKNKENKAKEEEEIDYYIVQEGDSLTNISSNLGDDITITKLIAWNDLNSDLIHVGQKLIVDGGELSNVEIAQAEKLYSNSDFYESKSVEKSTNTTSVAQATTNTTTEKEESNPPQGQNKSNNDTNKSETVEVKEETMPEEPQAQGRTLTVESTAYTAYCNGCSGITATGIDLRSNPNAKVIAVDPNVIPLGSKVYVEGYGEAIAGDTGGAIKGNKIDIHVPSKDQAYSWGRRTVNVTIIE